jgi:hypothetical protein
MIDRMPGEPIVQIPLKDAQSIDDRETRYIFNATPLIGGVFHGATFEVCCDHRGDGARRSQGESMRKLCANVALIALVLGLVGVGTPSRAETGQVAVVFTKGGFIVGVGGGEGVLVLRGKRYPFTVSGMSVGFTIGASTTKLVGRAFNLTGPTSIEGAYSAIGAGGAVAAGAGGVQLQNANGVILQLSGPKVGAELSAAVGGVTVRLK